MPASASGPHLQHVPGLGGDLGGDVLGVVLTPGDGDREGGPAGGVGGGAAQRSAVSRAGGAGGALRDTHTGAPVRVGRTATYSHVSRCLK